MGLDNGKGYLQNQGIMCDNPISEAIILAGGVGKLATKLGVKHPAVIRWRSLWDEGRVDAIPANRAVQIEDATGVSRSRCRPDLWPDATRAAA